MNNEDVNKKIKKIEILSSMPIVISILHLIGLIIFQTNLKIENNQIINIITFPLLFGVSQFSLVVSSVTYNLTFIKGIVSTISIIVALTLIFTSYFVRKNAKICLLITLITYFVDFIFSVISVILFKNYNIEYNVLYIVFAIIIHLIGLSFITYTFVIFLRLTNRGKNE